jgi:hypothetical protein
VLLRQSNPGENDERVDVDLHRDQRFGHPMTSVAQEGRLDEAQLSEIYSGKAYSPYAARTVPELPLL